jgi:hypothetical protein
MRRKILMGDIAGPLLMVMLFLGVMIFQTRVRILVHYIFKMVPLISFEAVRELDSSFLLESTPTQYLMGSLQGLPYVPSTDNAMYSIELDA